MKEKEEDEEAVQSLSVGSGPSVEVGDGGGNSITCGNGVCDCDGVKRMGQDHRGRTVRKFAFQYVVLTTLLLQSDSGLQTSINQLSDL